MAVAERLVEGRAVRARHPEVAEDEVVGLDVEQGQGFGPVAGAVDGVPVAGQGDGEDLPEGVVVVDDEDTADRALVWHAQ